MKHTLAGKDAPLEDTIETLETILTELDLRVQPVQWLHPVSGCWSVHIRSERCPSLYTNGKGKSRKASYASGLAEFYERLVSGFFFSYFFVAEKDTNPFLYRPEETWFSFSDPSSLPTKSDNGKRLLNRDLIKFYDPDNELLPEHLTDCNSGHHPNKICALPFVSLTHQENIFFPTGLLANLYLSNGMAAGNNSWEARAQALSEIIERYVKNIIISKGIALPDIPNNQICRFPHLLKIVEELAASNLLVKIKDGSLGGRYPVICVLLTDCESGGVYAGFGANLRFEVAVERTLTDLLQGRSLSMLRDFSQPSHNVELVADPMNLESHFIDSDGLLSWTMFRDKPDYPYQPWDFSGSTQRECNKLIKMINSWGFTPFCADTGSANFHGCRIIVPGMFEVIDDLIWNNRWQGCTIRDQLLKLHTLDDNQIADLIDSMERLGLNDDQTVADCIGVLFEQTSPWYDFHIGELRMYCHLALRDLEQANHYLQWSLDSKQLLQHPKEKQYQLLASLINLHEASEQPDDYQSQLKAVYGEQAIVQAQSLMTGSIKFPELDTQESWQASSPLQHELVNVYREVRSMLYQNRPD